MEREYTGMRKLAQAEETARANARPEPLHTDGKEIKPRLEMPSQAEIVNLKKLYGLRTLGQPKQ